MKSKIICLSEFFLAGVFLLYALVLHLVNPGTLLSACISFSNCWLFAGVFCLVLAVYRARRKKSAWYALLRWQQIAVGVVLFVGVTVSAVNLFLILHPASCEPQPNVRATADSVTAGDAQYVIVLGGGIDKHGALPPAVQARAELAAAYLREHTAALAVVTGGTLYKLPREAPAIQAYLVGLGIAPDRILLEDKALDTIQNFRNSAALLSEHEKVRVQTILESRVLVVTSFFHLARAERLAHRMGFSRVSGLGSPIPAYKVPDSYAREICAYIKLNLRILLTGKPSRITD